MKKIAFAALLSLFATGGASAQYYDLGISGEWVARGERCNCGNVMRAPSVYSGGGGFVTFTNPCGDSAAGRLSSQGVYRVDAWGVSAYVLNASQIRWSNGCYWTR
jgi:hypothetical protein